MEDTINDYLKAHIDEPMSDVLQGLEEEIQSHASDRRYKTTRAHVLSNRSGTSWGGMFYFRGVLYYFNVTRPCDMYPSGKIEADSMH